MSNFWKESLKECNDKFQLARLILVGIVLSTFVVITNVAKGSIHFWFLLVLCFEYPLFLYYLYKSIGILKNKGLDNYSRFADIFNKPKKVFVLSMISIIGSGSLKYVLDKMTGIYLVLIVVLPILYTVIISDVYIKITNSPVH